MKITGNEPYYPFFRWNEGGNGNAIVVFDTQGGNQFFPYDPGITIRQEFAKAAMQGILSDPSSYDLTKIAALAVVCADNLIAELNKTEK